MLFRFMGNSLDFDRVESENTNYAIDILVSKYKKPKYIAFIYYYRH